MQIARALLQCSLINPTYHPISNKTRFSNMQGRYIIIHKQKEKKKKKHSLSKLDLLTVFLTNTTLNLDQHLNILFPNKEIKFIQNQTTASPISTNKYIKLHSTTIIKLKINVNKTRRKR